MAADPRPYQEQALVIPGPLAPLLGILCLPAPGQHTGSAAPTTGVLVLVGGAQYRAGSHRQFVHLARRLAPHGYPVLRFDLAGMGDSPGPMAPFDATEGDVAAAIDALLQAVPSLQQVVLWGLCDGASAALLYLQRSQDRRVAGVALLNPWVRSEASLAQATVKHYYSQRLLQPAFWRKLLSGQVGGQAMRDLWHNLRASASPGPQPPASFQQRMAEGLRQLPGPALVLLSERDLTAQEFAEYTRRTRPWPALLQAPRVSQHTLPGADHTCATPGSQALAEQLTLQWLQQAVDAVNPGASSSAS